LETSTNGILSNEAESKVGSSFVPERAEEWEPEVKPEEDGEGTEDAPEEAIGYGDQTSFLESISGLLNDFLGD